MNDRWKVQLQGGGFAYLLGDERVALKGTLAQSFRLFRNSSLSFDCAFTRVGGHGVPEAVLLAHRYF